jgi:uncharacterized protein YyaL (SSP411 family)
MGFGGGWPLSVFLTPERKPFFGGTYFPPEDALNKPGFMKVMKAVVDFYKSKREDISSYSEKLIDALKPTPSPQGEIKEPIVVTAASTILSSFDLKRWLVSS